MLKVLVDTDIFLDIFLECDPSSIYAEALWLLLETDRIKGFITTITLSEIYNFGKRNTNSKSVEEAISEILKITQLIPGNSTCIEKHNVFNDKILTREYIQLSQAINLKFDVIVSRTHQDQYQQLIDNLNSTKKCIFSMSAQVFLEKTCSLYSSPIDFPHLNVQPYNLVLGYFKSFNSDSEQTQQQELYWKPIQYLIDQLAFGIVPISQKLIIKQILREAKKQLAANLKEAILNNFDHIGIILKRLNQIKEAENIINSESNIFLDSSGFSFWK